MRREQSGAGAPLDGCVLLTLPRAARSDRPENEGDREPARSRSRAIAGHSGSDVRRRRPHMPRLRTLAARRIDRGISSCRTTSSCAASVRPRAQRFVLPGACGRWRCRWNAHATLVAPLVSAGVRSAAARARALSSARCLPVRGARAAARRRATIGWRRARTRSSATCSGSATRPVGAVRDVDRATRRGVGAGDGLGPGAARRRERARFVRAHRRSVQRWLDDLEAAGLVVHEPERDARLVVANAIVLLAAPGRGPRTCRGLCAGAERAAMLTPSVEARVREVSRVAARPLAARWAAP